MTHRGWVTWSCVRENITCAPSPATCPLNKKAGLAAGSLRHSIAVRRYCEASILLIADAAASPVNVSLSGSVCTSLHLPLLNIT